MEIKGRSNVVAEQNDLIREAASSVTNNAECASAANLGRNSNFASSGIMDTISDTRHLIVTSDWETPVGGGEIKTADYIMLLVNFYGVTVRNDATSVSVTVTSDKSKGKSHTMTTTEINRRDVYLFMYNGDGRVFFPKGSTVNVTAKTNTGWLDIDSCKVSASVYDLRG